jgi:zinc transporter, ZIP family
MSALAWGVVAASSLVLGALFALWRRWPDRWVGAVLAFGAGALISAVSFELALEGFVEGDSGFLASGIAAGALTYFLLDRLISRSTSPHGGSGGSTDTEADGGPALALGAFLDGVPEQLVLGIGLAAGNGVSVGLLVAIFVSNLPEAVGSASDMRDEGRSRRFIIALWIAVAVVCALATVVGFAIADAFGGNFRAVVDGIAAGALLVMLVDSMIPEAARKTGAAAGLLTVLGFSIAAALSAYT